MAYQQINTGGSPTIGLKPAGDIVNNNATEAKYQGGFFTASGTANAIVLTSEGGITAPASYVTGQKFRFIVASTNTGTTTLNVDGLGIKTLKTISGNDLPSGYLPSGKEICAYYDGVNITVCPPISTELSGRNLLINGDFSVNQEAVSGTVSLAAGEYGHDMWKAGASGCTYTFATSAGVTTITITAGTLLQIVEATYLPASAVVLSWAGTSTGRIDSGSYGASGTVTDTTTGGTNVTVEFTTGTLSQAQLEKGISVTAFEYVNPEVQLAKCHRHLYKIEHDGVALAVGNASAYTDGVVYVNIRFPVTMRATPSISSSIASQFNIFMNATGTTPTSISAEAVSKNNFDLRLDKSAAFTVGHAGFVRMIAAGNFIQADARL